MKYSLVLILILSIFLIACNTNQQFSQTPEPIKVDLCNEISVPTAQVNCIDNGRGYTDYCNILISGDSRMVYYVAEFGSWGVSGPEGAVYAGQITKLKSNNQDRIEVTPYPENKFSEKCDNKKIVIYRNQFTGKVSDFPKI